MWKRSGSAFVGSSRKLLARSVRLSFKTGIGLLFTSEHIACSLFLSPFDAVMRVCPAGCFGSFCGLLLYFDKVGHPKRGRVIAQLRLQKEDLGSPHAKSRTFELFG